MKKIIISVILTVLMLCTFAACGEKTVSAEKMYNINVSGYSGEGVLIVSPDYKYATTLAIEVNGEKFTDSHDLLFQILFSDGLEIEADSDLTELSNGDKIKFTVTYAEDAFKEVGVKISPTEFTYTVEGLEEKPPVEKVDVFEGMAVTFEGVSPYIKASFSGSEYTAYVSYNLSKTAPLKNGDTVTLTATPNDKLLSEKNSEPIAITKEYTVEGFPEYISDISKYDLTSINETLAANAKKKVSGDYNLGSKQYSLFFMGYDGGNLVEYWVTDSTELKLAAQYYFTPKVISESEPSNWNSANGKYSNFLLNIYAYEITATKQKQGAYVSDGYKTGEQETFILYMMSDVTNLRDTGDGALNFDNSEYFTSFYRNPDWLKSADEVFARFEDSYAADYNIEKIN
jgi:hypothetical protein